LNGYLVAVDMLRDPAGPVSALMEPVAPAIRLEGVARRFGQRWILRGIDLTVEPGEVLAMTGRNGSGKTTLLRIIGTLLRPTRGTAGFRPRHGARRGRRPRVGGPAGSQQRALYDDLTAAENLVFSLRMAGRRRTRTAIEAAWSTSAWPTFGASGCAASPPACGAGSAWPACCCGRPGCCCWTSRMPASTRTASTWSTSSPPARPGRRRAHADDARHDPRHRGHVAACTSPMAASPRCMRAERWRAAR
jgi:energy-coupling factor transporter ATP-binding protein EcfA2